MSNFFESVYDVVKQIPKGQVMTYGQVARLLGTRNARLVGFALNKNHCNETIPCHRVVFKDGRLSPAFAFGGESRQKALLIAEGVAFNGECVDMAKCQVKN